MRGTVESDWRFGQNPERYRQFVSPGGVQLAGDIGKDYLTDSGTPVFAAAPGVVEYGDDPTGWGRYLRIRHDDGSVSQYAHLSEYLVPEGTRITDPDLPIAKVGNSGYHYGGAPGWDGSHLDFAYFPQGYQREDRYRGAADPNALFGQPLDGGESSSAYPYQEIVRQAAEQYGLQENLLRAMIQQESEFNPNARSHAGAMGLMQLMPGTARDLGVANPYDPYENVMGGAKYMDWLLDEWGGDTSKALASYNGGIGNIRRGYWPAETQRYVPLVMDYYQGYGR